MARSRVSKCIGIAVAYLSLATCVKANLIQYWSFDDGSGTTAANSVGGGNTGNLNGSPAWITTGLAAPLISRVNNPSTAALDFGGGGDYVDGGNINLVSDGGGGQATVSMWVRSDVAAPSDDRLWGQLSGSSSAEGAARYNAPGGGLQLWRPSTNAWETVGGTLPNGTWAHVAIVWNLDQATAYVNGSLAGTTTVDFDFGAANFGIAAKYLNTFGDGFQGAIDDVSIWNEALAPAVIGQLAEGESPLSIIPEPSSGILFVLGPSTAFGWVRRKKR